MAKRRSRKSKMPKGFVSKAQWRFFFFKGKRNPKFRALAHKEAHKTPGGKKVRYRRLPARKGARRRR